jgi:hypothetical protein
VAHTRCRTHLIVCVCGCCACVLSMVQVNALAENQRCAGCAAAAVKIQ